MATIRTEGDIIADLRCDVCASAGEEFDERLDWFADACESPIERVLAAAIISHPLAEVLSFRKGRREPLPVDILFESAPTGQWISVSAIYPQAFIDRYRADFYIESFHKDTRMPLFRCAIECDGHDFHEKTKDQVARDKRRDRWFQARGIAVLRFSGAEIWADPASCAEQIFNCFLAAVQRSTAHS